MTGDRALLEMAAKAAGLVYIGDDGFHDGEPCCYDEELDINYVWRPDLDDGYSRLLQVACRIEIRWAGGGWVVRAHDCDSGTKYGLVGRDGDDEAEALRMAVLRAAAEIGKRMS